VNVADFLHATAARQPDLPAVTDMRSGRSLTFGAVAREADRVAAFLRAQGVERGQRIGLLAPNGMAYLPAAFGLLSADACLVPIASNLTPVEAREILDRVDVNGCLVWPEADRFPRVEARARLSGGECDGFEFRWIQREAEAPAGFRGLNPAFIRFTSGTTAHSKGVVLSHEATAARVAASDRVLGFSEQDRILWVLPLAYHFAVTIVAYVRAGAQVLMCSDAKPRLMVEAIERHRATVLYASPLHFERMANLGPSSALRSLRVALSTSAPIAPSVMERFESAYGIRVGQAYGIIEAGLPCINPGTGDVPAASVGRPVPGYEVAVLSDEGERLSSGAMGEIGLRGDGLFSAYYAPWTTREQISRDGWFLTGDIGVLDASGALHLKGRKKAVIFVAGLKFFPEEVEQCIDQFPGVRESRVFARPHPHLGEIPYAEIALGGAAIDVEALKAHCNTRLSPYKVPLEFRIVDAVPRTPGGKILRRPTEGEPGRGASRPAPAERR
jgi:acyl-CoA synthetase (AMP-forming)/AMP-acid ligase II